MQKAAIFWGCRTFDFFVVKCNQACSGIDGTEVRKCLVSSSDKVMLMVNKLFCSAGDLQDAYRDLHVRKQHGCLGLNVDAGRRC